MRSKGSSRVLHALFVLVASGSSLLAAGCGSDPVAKNDEPDPETRPDAQTLKFTVDPSRRTYLDLSVPAVVQISGDASASRDWDLALAGYSVLTNGGLSGSGAGSAFGPLSTSFFAFPEDPVEVPFLIEDRAGGAFLGWYAYDGSTHTIYSRFHSYGVRSADRLYKLQIESYYGEVEGAPVSALYQLRYAPVTAEGPGDVRQIDDIDATLGGEAADPSLPSACVSLDTGETTLLTPAEAAESPDWNLCFRREAISVNGELGGPGETSAVDLAADATAGEVLADVKKRTSASELAAFEAIDGAALTASSLEYRGDYATSAFTNKWVNPETNPPTLRTDTAFLVVGADGNSRFLVTFESIEGATAITPGTVTLFVQPTASP